MKRFYTRFSNLWERELGKIFISETIPEINTFDNATLLPLRRRKDLACKAFEGGVVLDNKKFVAGIQRSKRNFQLPFSCTKGYRFVGDTLVSDKEIVFAGILYGHFGHVLIDSCDRLYHYARHPDQKPYVFLVTPETNFRYKSIFDLAGMNWSICNKPTCYKKVIVPNEAFFSNDRGYTIWLEWWDHLKKRAIQVYSHNSFPEKIYLTRTQFEGNDGINEEFYENYYKNLGYSIISPEQKPLEEQICIIAHAKKIVCTMGTLAHMLVFAQEGTDITILLRSPKSILISQLIINKLKKFNWRCIEATINPLPTSQSNGVFLYTPTDFFREYCNDMGLPQPECFTPSNDMILKYFNKWKNNYKKLLSWGYIKNLKAIDFLESISYFFDGKEIDREDYINYKP